MPDEELEAFKTQIDLRQYAASRGYAWDRRESWRGSVVMRTAADKIIIKRGGNGHYVYFSVRDDADNGTIIDFIQRRQRCSLGTVRKELRAWMGLAHPSPLPVFPTLEKTPKDRRKVELAFSAMSPDPLSAYLEKTRGLPGAITRSPRFLGCSRIDNRGNLAFPHFDENGLSGFELKNAGFTGFAAGGEKGLWLSNESQADGRLVFCESAIECLSYAVLFPDGKTRLASIGGKLSPAQPKLIKAAIERMPAESEIVAAMNADEEGRQLAQEVQETFDKARLPGGNFVIREPEGFNDWNDQLRALAGAPALPAVLTVEL